MRAVPVGVVISQRHWLRTCRRRRRVNVRAIVIDSSIGVAVIVSWVVVVEACLHSEGTTVNPSKLGSLIYHLARSRAI